MLMHPQRQDCKDDRAVVKMKRRRNFHWQIFSQLRQVRKNVIDSGGEDQKRAGPALSNQMPVQQSTSSTHT